MDARRGAKRSQQLPHPARRQRRRRTSRTLASRLVAAIPSDLQAPGVPLHLRAGERARDQRLRAARRADVRQPRHDRSGEHRRRGGRRHGARAEPRRSCATAPPRRARRTKYQIGQVAGAVLGAIIGGGWGQVISQGTQFGLGTAFLRFSREYEQQADMLGAQIMARAGYDPRDMANMFKTIEKAGRLRRAAVAERSPEPGQSRRLHHQGSRDAPGREPDPRHARRSRRCRRISSRCRRRRPRSRRRATPAAVRPAPPVKGACRPGACRRRRRAYRTYTEGDMFQVSVPSNWREIQRQNAVTFAPDGAYGQANGQSVFTHGVELGAARNETHDLQDATERADRVARPVQPRPASLLRSGPRQPLGPGRPPQRADQQPIGDGPAGVDRHLHDAAARRQSLLCRGGRAAERLQCLPRCLRPRHPLDSVDGIDRRSVGDGLRGRP